MKDLKGAKIALQSKSQLISELERIIRQRETECKTMDDRLQTYSEQMSEMSDRLKTEADLRLESERQALELREALGAHPVGPTARKIHQQEKAAQLIRNLAEKRSRQATANAFRHWACAASAMKAVSHQIHVAHALSHQLETTREKLVILKSHLKQQKNRRLGGVHASRSTSRARHALERLEEGDESFTL